MRPIDEIDFGLWPTPAAHEFEGGDPAKMWARREREKAKGRNGNGFGLTLGMLATVGAPSMAMWSTLTANDAKNCAAPSQFERNSQALNVQAVAHGQALHGSSAPTEKPGALNPAFGCWLMGFPPEWDACAPMATRSSRRSPRKSSARSSTLGVFG
jgi:hypothetical protein